MSSLYRSHRPRSFDKLVGQEHVVRTLRNAIELDKVHHAYLFVGSRGTGKTSMAKILASALNCEVEPGAGACGNCESCRAIAEGTSLDVIEMDAASNRSVDDIRDLRERVGYAPTAGRWKVYILDEAHMLTKEAWNAFLKTLEEPPPHTVFVLATTEAHKVMPTIVDRCQRFDFQRPTTEAIETVLDRVAEAEGIEIEDQARAVISRSARGSFRDALGTLDQLVAYGGKEVALADTLEVLGVADAGLVFQAAEAIASGSPQQALAAIAAVEGSGRDLAQFGRDLMGHLRHLLVAGATGEMPLSFAVTAAEPDRVLEQAKRIPEPVLVRAVEEIAAALREVREGADARVMLEVALIKACRPQGDDSLPGILSRLERLESGAAPAAAAAPQQPPPAPEPPPVRAESPPPPVAEEPPPPPVADEPPPPEQPPAEEQAPEPAIPLDLSRVLELWPAVVDQIRHQGSMVLATLFEGARPVRVEDGRLVIGFPAEARFNRRRAEAPESREQLAGAVRTVLGSALQPVFDLVDSSPTGTEPDAEVDENTLVELVKREFAATEEPPSPSA